MEDNYQKLESELRSKNKILSQKEEFQNDLNQKFSQQEKLIQQLNEQLSQSLAEQNRILQDNEL